MPEFLKIQMGGEAVTVPVYNPADVANDQLRVGQGGSVYAFRLESPNATPDHALRVGINGTTYAISTSSADIIEDFEDGVWPGDWMDEVSKAALTTNALEGNYSVQFTEDTTPNIAKDYTTQRGYTYSCRVWTPWPDASGSEPQLLVNSQWATSPHSRYDAYAAWLDIPDNQLYVVKWTDSTTKILTLANVTLSQQTEYVLALDVSGTQVRARVFDASRNHLASTGWANDTEYSGGVLAITTDGGDQAGIRFDDFQRHPIGTI